MRRARKPATAAVLCLLIAGCGSDSATTAFEAGYKKATAALQLTGADITRTIFFRGHRTAAQVATQFTGFADRFDAQLIQLESLKPPAEVSKAFATVTAAANRIETDLRAVASSANRRDAIGARTAVNSLITDARALNSGASAVRQKLGFK